MRIFWVIFGLLAIAAVAWLVRPSGSPDSAGPAPSDAPAQVELASGVGPPARGAEAAAIPGPVAEAPAVSTTHELPPAATEPNPGPAAGAAPQPAASGKPDATSTRPEAPSAVLSPSSERAGAYSSTPTPGTPEPEAVRASSVQTQPDGSLLVEGKYVLKGEGTKSDPYILTWDQLVSAEQDYVPKDGRKKIPERIQMLNGRWIQITGYIAFPVMADSQDECLSMLNQWDGCCVGVPPTPYDAVEVHLREVAEGKDRMASYGTVRGRFKVDPQLVGGWLIGLYVMEDATMKPQTFGGIAP